MINYMQTVLKKEKVYGEKVGKVRLWVRVGYK